MKSPRLRYLKAFFALQISHTEIHRALESFKTNESDNKVLAQMLLAYDRLGEALEAMGYKPPTE